MIKIITILLLVLMLFCFFVIQNVGVGFGCLITAAVLSVLDARSGGNRETLE